MPRFVTRMFIIRIILIIAFQLWIIVIFIQPWTAEDLRTSDDPLQELGVYKNRMISCRDPVLVPKRGQKLPIRKRQSMKVFSTLVVCVQLWG